MRLNVDTWFHAYSFLPSSHHLEGMITVQSLRRGEGFNEKP